MNNKGVSMLEVLVAMIVLTIGLLGVAPMVVLSIKGNTMSRDTIVTSKLAKEKIEYFESLKTLPAVPYERSERSADDIYGVKVTIQNNTTDVSIPVGVYEINVIIDWKDELNLPKQVTYSTYLRKGPLHAIS